MKRWVAALAVSGMAVSALSACGADDEGGAGGDHAIKVMMIAALETPVFSAPWLETAAQAAVDEINADGGVDGRKIEAEFCNDKFDPNEAVACAQRAISDGYVAIIGGVTGNSGAFAPLLEAAGIPFIGPGGADPVNEATLPSMYPISAGGIGNAIGAASLAVSRGGTDVAVLVGDAAGSRANGEVVEQAVRDAGGEPTVSVIPAAAADYSGLAAATVEAEPDAVTVTAPGSDASRVVSALRGAGYDGVITGPTSIVTADSIEALGEDAEGLILTSRGLPTTTTDNPLIQEFRDAMQEADPEAPIDDLGLNAYLSVKVFAGVIAGHDITDGRSVTDALDSIDEPIDLGGVYPDYPGIQDPAPNPDFPRIAVFETLPALVQDGQIVADGDFFDPTEAEQ